MTGRTAPAQSNSQNGCRVRTDLDGVTVRMDETALEPYPTTREPRRHDFWAHWVEHEANGEVETKSYGPEAYGHIDVIVIGL